MNYKLSNFQNILLIYIEENRTQGPTNQAINKCVLLVLENIFHSGVYIKKKTSDVTKFVILKFNEFKLLIYKSINPLVADPIYLVCMAKISI